jgi:hypothetical protein
MPTWKTTSAFAGGAKRDQITRIQSEIAARFESKSATCVGMKFLHPIFRLIYRGTKSNWNPNSIIQLQGQALIGAFNKRGIASLSAKMIKRTLQIVITEHSVANTTT